MEDGRWELEEQSLRSILPNFEFRSILKGLGYLMRIFLNLIYLSKSEIWRSDRINITLSQSPRLPSPISQLPSLTKVVAIARK
jgi:hypothetical protein